MSHARLGAGQLLALMAMAVLTPELTAAQTPTASASSGNGPQRIIEISGGLGATVVDLELWNGGPISNYWSTTNYQVSGLVLPLRIGKLALGGEFAYQYLFWYNTAPYEYEYEYSVLKFMFRGRVGGDSGPFFDFGAGAYRFDGWTDFGVAVGGGYAINLGARLSLPIKARVDFIFDGNQTLVAPAGCVGLAIKF
jgi:hypothetical protein